MKAINLKDLCATISLLVGLGGMSAAHADLYFGNLGAAASATDVYGMTCPLPPVVGARANVNDVGAADGIFVSVQVVNPHGRATNASVDGGVSPTVNLPQQQGQYLVQVNKDMVGAQSYYLYLDCYNNAGDLIGTQSWLVQDQ